MLDFLSFLIQFAFVLFMGFALSLFFFTILLAWSAAQFRYEEMSHHPSLIEILTTAAIEWGGMMTVLGSQWKALEPFHDLPKFDSQNSYLRARPTQLPIILVPSLHWNSGMFRVLFWRLKQNYCKSLWPFSWKTFLREPGLLEDQLTRFLCNVIETTGSKRLFLISFGTSRPIVGRVLNLPELNTAEVRWIAVSAPSALGSALQFLATPKVRKAYAAIQSQAEPALLITGLRDSLCYPREKVFQHPNVLNVPEMGHYGALMHSKGVQAILSELESEKFIHQQRILEQQL